MRTIAARFRRLVTLTIVATFVLILIGGIVRVSDSGLGCGAAGSGTHGWPLCEGGVLPADSAESVIEFTHRIAATVVTVLIALMAWRASAACATHRCSSAARSPPACSSSPRRPRRAHGRGGPRGRARRRPPRPRDAPARPALRPPPRRRSRRRRRAARGGPRPAAAGHRHRGAGAGDDRRRRLRRRHRVPRHPDQPLVGAHTACGTGWSTAQFPGCNGQGALSFGQSRLADIQLTHRLFMYLAAISVLALGGARAAPPGAEPRLLDRPAAARRADRARARSTSGPASTPG